MEQNTTGEVVLTSTDVKAPTPPRATSRAVSAERNEAGWWLTHRRRQPSSEPKGDVFVGLDVHANSIAITAVDGHGSVVLRRTVERTNEHLVALAGHLEGYRRFSAYEVGCLGFGMHRRLEALGFINVVVTADKLAKGGGRRIKTDKRDSAHIAEALRNGVFDRNTVWVPPSPSDEQRRELIRTREQLIEHASAIKRQIKSKLLVHSIVIPEDLQERLWSAAGCAWLVELQKTNSVVGICVDILVKTHRDIDVRIAELDQMIVAMFERDETRRATVERLRTIPGVGAQTAIAFMLEVINIRRFEDSDRFSSWLGLVPSENSSGDSTRRGEITKAGNAALRRVLVLAAWRLVCSKSPEAAPIRARFDALKARCGSNRAIVAIARLLAKAMRMMWLHHLTWSEWIARRTLDIAGPTPNPTHDGPDAETQKPAREYRLDGMGQESQAVDDEHLALPSPAPTQGDKPPKPRQGLTRRSITMPRRKEPQTTV